MKFTASTILGLVWLGRLVQAGSVLPRKFIFDGNTCDSVKQDIIRLEMANAVEMANDAKNIDLNSIYYEAFISQTNRNKGDSILNTIRDRFSHVAQMAQESDEAYEIKVTCDNNSDKCHKKPPWLAHMNARTRIMNFCDGFFTSTGIDREIKATQDRIDQCHAGQITLTQAQWSRAAVIVHECTHTSFAMTGEKKTLDYAYGFRGCYKLAHGTLNRDCALWKDPAKVLCPRSETDRREGMCPETRDIENADTYSFLAAAMYFTKHCGYEIPLPPIPPPDQPPVTKREARGSHLFRRQEACPVDDEVIIIDVEDSFDEMTEDQGTIGDGDDGTGAGEEGGDDDGPKTDDQGGIGP